MHVLSTFSSLLLITAAFMISDSYQTRRIRDVSGHHSGSGAIANFAMKALTSFQSFMKEGNNELGIPRLDPVHMDNFNYSLDNNPVGFRMEIVFESPALVGLSSYELNGASELRGPDGSTVVQMTIVFPTIQIRGRYKANGNMFSFFNLASSGDFEIIGSSQVLAAEAKLRPVNQTLFVDYITSQFVGGRVKSQFNDVSNSGHFTTLMNEFLSAMGTHVFDKKLKPVITTAMNDYMKEWLNGAFSSVTTSEILGQQSSGGATTPQQQQYSPPPQPQQSPQQFINQQQQQPQPQQQQSPSSNVHQFQPFGK
ncbi:uncharacterized protein LOC110860602 [Folsomia candida]|uniref:Protein takeout n=1 Tax=Folsomia candida TaxID=158441 RepID=A0A226D628_FOLCA|nr:uncharacterized protein LOC110860602 [Folsomia candida]OXA40550.1 hypothetical protein Fcan01_24762 [Folsomia candida]